MTPTQTHAALLSDEEINARIRGSEVHEYHPGAILELVRELEQDILSKLKPPPSMLTNDELIDLAVEHGLGRKMPPLGLNTGNDQQVMRDDVWLCTTAALKPAQAAQGESDVATWLWLRFADYCRKQGMNPHHQNDLFAIVHDLRAMLASPTPPAQQKGGEA